jgi:polysaccharide export outer membrane protein
VSATRVLCLLLGCAACSVSSTAAQTIAQTTARVDYIIQPSDVVAIKYRYTPEFDFAGAVLPDGTVNPPLLGAVTVAGLTVVQVHDLLVAKAAERLRGPELSIELREFEKPHFVVGGEVGAPGRFDLKGRVSVLEAIAIAGGLKTSAKRSRVVVYRRCDDRTAMARVIQTKDLMRSEGMNEYLVEPGDFILIPRSAYAEIEKFVPLANIAFFNPLIWR